ncbi:efflux RND transporter periplasmic adaptor subunit [Gimesia algae]|uniref:Efflux pump periplasmic linker BepF n=1 Tax=Gimesia algae TaxID=2527971 RepID=A0A517VGX0_9PLAN|nr:efflux RND transporter periplasmic adaptor subunit [Gimesia algae]QDT92263.1 Efflux pump periplasmic linker BepF [Gimesia algae]
MQLSPLSAISLMLLTLSLPACSKLEGHSAVEHHEEHPQHKIVVTSPMAKDVISTQQYVCQIHSYRHIEIRALENGYLEEIPVKEGQLVKQGSTMFTILPTLYQAKLNAEKAEVQLAQIEYDNTERLYRQNVVAKPEVALAKAKLAKVTANMQLTQAELDFATIKAPFEGIIDKQHHQQGSLISEGDILTTLSDNSVMWVYFNVPEARYLEYKADPNRDDIKVELQLADGSRFPQVGKIGAIEADFNNETGNISFRADFPNPNGLLRHGQTGNILLSRVIKDAIVIPQRATYEILAKKYAYVVGKDDLKEHMAKAENHTANHEAKGHAEHGEKHAAKNAEKHEVKHAEKHPGKHEGEHAGEHGIVHQREIVILKEQDDIFLVKEGLDVNDKIILEGIQQVRDGEQVKYEYLAPEKALAVENLKFAAE